MVPHEFKLAILVNNSRQTRIMLTDSLILDPTFDRFDEMLSYAERQLPDIIVPFDGENLENDISKWNRELMDRESVQLIDNFSKKRIEHLKKVITQVMASKIDKLLDQKITSEKKANQQKALRQMAEYGKKISDLMKRREQNNNKWTGELIKQMEDAAKKLLNIIESYNRNR